MAAIKSIKAREVLDSRGNPTIEAEISTGKFSASSIVPSGASTGKYEALELRDKESRYNGKGVLKAVSNVKDIISKKIIGQEVDVEKIDRLMLELDGTENKSKLGANAMLAVSMATCKLAALKQNIPLYSYLQNISGTKKLSLPVPMLNIINGGKHAGMENDIQEHMIMPVGFKSYKEGLRASVEVYHSLKSLVKKKYGSALLGDEGGFAPKVESSHSRLELIKEAIEKAGYGEEMALALDCASSEFFYEDHYKMGDKKLSAGELIDFYKELAEKYNIISIEDGMDEDDWEGWKELTSKLGNKIQLVGDDLLVTNVNKIKRAIEEKSCNALLLKVNQIGTVTEAINAAKMSFDNNWNVVVSHRSGETEDTFIADLVVGLNAGQSKFGAPARSERTAKYNRLLQIEAELGNKAAYTKLR